MDITLDVITPATDINLVTLYEARLALNMVTSNNPTVDDQIELMAKWASAEIATYCARTFARETVAETFRDLNGTARIYLSHYPVSEIASVDENGVILARGTDYVVDINSGTLRRLPGAWGSPVTVTYTGGYDLPYRAPPALSRAALLLTREAYFAATRGDATVRMISHKEARVIYFDPNAKSAGSAAGGSPLGGSSAAFRAIRDLLNRFIRIQV